MKFLCRIFGHNMRSDTSDVAGPSHCCRKGCDHKEPGIDWGLPSDPPGFRIAKSEPAMPGDDLRRAFVMGAKWREFNRTGTTLWQSDQRLAEEEAEKRYPRD